MQLFIPYQSYEQSAQALDDKRLNKQIIEAAQIASTAFWINNCQKAEFLTSPLRTNPIYFPTHEHRLLCRWASENKENFLHVVHLGFACAIEYEFRFKKFHKTLITLGRLFAYYHNIKFKNYPSPQPNCTTNHRYVEDTNEAYQRELNLKWFYDISFPTWTKRDVPKFYQN